MASDYESSNISQDAVMAYLSCCYRSCAEALCLEKQRGLSVSLTSGRALVPQKVALLYSAGRVRQCTVCTVCHMIPSTVRQRDEIPRQSLHGLCANR